MGIGRVGGVASNGSGDIFIAFSAANEEGWHDSEVTTVEMYPNSRMTPFFEATVAAVEEAIVNAMVAARTMEGINGNRVHAIPHERLQTALERYGRLER
jgi:L-aminopeptidase/D-esterase-like protein